MFDLDRFLKAQGGYPGFDAAMRELRAGGKRSHWIWYVFPQLRGLGTSPLAVRYGLDGVEEAEAYLRHDELKTRLAFATEAAAAQLRAGVPLEVLMGSAIDGRKLVSSMTLFGPLAQTESARHPSPAAAILADGAEEILRIAAAQGYPRCAFTADKVRAHSSGSPPAR